MAFAPLHFAACNDEVEQHACRLRCMMWQLRSARAVKLFPSPKSDMLRGVMMVAHITPPLFQLQRSWSKKLDFAYDDEVMDSINVAETATDVCHPAPEERECSLLVTVSDDELGDVSLVTDSRYESEDRLDT